MNNNDQSNFNFIPISIETQEQGKSIKVVFESNETFIILSELLRVESPSAEVQGHGGPKIIVKNKSEIKITAIEKVGNYAIRIIFSDSHSSGIYSWPLLYSFGKNQKKMLSNYYSSL